MLGFRVGETLGGGDGHGLLASNLRLLTEIGSDGRPRADRDVIVEATLEHSKTKHRRVLPAALSSNEPGCRKWRTKLRYSKDSSCAAVVVFLNGVTSPSRFQSL